MKQLNYIHLLFSIGIILAVQGCGPSKGEVSQELTNIYSGEYKGAKIPSGYTYKTYNIDVDPVKYVKKNEYEAYVTGYIESGMGSVASLAGGKMSITISNKINPKTGKTYSPKICFHDKYGSSMLGGDPCDPYFMSNPKGLDANGDTLFYEMGAIILKGKIIDKRANRFYREDLNNQDKDKWE